MGRSQCHTPSATTFAKPRTHWAVEHQPLRISRHPNIPIRAPALRSRSPLNRLIQWTADILAPRILDTYAYVMRFYFGFHQKCLRRDYHAEQFQHINS